MVIVPFILSATETRATVPRTGSREYCSHYANITPSFNVFNLVTLDTLCEKFMSIPLIHKDSRDRRLADKLIPRDPKFPHFFYGD